MTEETRSFPNGNEVVEGQIAVRREGEIEARSERELIDEIHAGIKIINKAAVIVGKALRELRRGPQENLTAEQWRDAKAGPKGYLSQKDWDKYLKAEFNISYSTSHKWVDMADADDLIGEDDSFPIGNTVWENMPPRWTSQHNIISKLDAGEVVVAILTERITPLSTGKQIAEVIADIRHEPVTSPPAETFLERALSNLLDARTQHKAGNSFKKDHDERDLAEALSKVGNEFRRMVSAVQDEGKEEEEPEWAHADAEPAAARKAPKRDLGAEWHAEVRRCYEEADEALNGYLVSNKSAGISGRSLFTGPKSRAMKHASDELKEWWLTHPRPMSRNDWIKANRERDAR
jgi:hypothetical protein